MLQVTEQEMTEFVRNGGPEYLRGIEAIKPGTILDSPVEYVGAQRDSGRQKKRNSHGRPGEAPLRLPDDSKKDLIRL